MLKRLAAALQASQGSEAGFGATMRGQLGDDDWGQRYGDYQQMREGALQGGLMNRDAGNVVRTYNRGQKREEATGSLIAILYNFAKLLGTGEDE